MRRGEESDGAFQLLGDARVVEIREQHDERAMLEQCPDADRGGRRIRLRRLHRELLERTAQAHHPRKSARRRAAREHPVRIHHEPDAIVVVRHHFGEACGEIGIEAEAVESPDAHPAEAPGVDADQDVEMLILAELARDERAGASRRLPVDAGQGVTGRIGAQLVQLGAGAAHAPRPRPARKSPRPHRRAQRIRSHDDARVRVERASPPGEPERAQHPRRQRRPRLRPEAHG